MKKPNKPLVFENLEYCPNRMLIATSPRILETNQKVCFKDGFYFTESMDVVCKTSYALGRIFKPI